MIITISGKPGSGKSTIAKLLAKKLKYKHHSAGDFFREMARERGISILDLVRLSEKNPEINQMTDKRTAALGKSKDNFVIDGRLAWKFIPHSFKVFLDVNVEEAARRLAGLKREQEAYSTIAKAMAEVKKRIASEKKQYRKQYGIELYNKRNYDLVIDTTKKTPDEIVRIIFGKIKP